MINHDLSRSLIILISSPNLLCAGFTRISSENERQFFLAKCIQSFHMKALKLSERNPREKDTLTLYMLSGLQFIFNKDKFKV